MSAARRNSGPIFQHDEDSEALVEVPQVLTAQDTQSKWVVGVVSAALVALLAFFASENYKSVQSQLLDHQGRLSAVELQVAAQREVLARIEASQVRQEAMLAEALKERRR
jgi:hypothetical protein